MNPLYAVVFDNDPEYPGQLQFVNVANEEEYLEGAGTNITLDLNQAVYMIALLDKLYPNINYRVVRVVLEEM